MVRRSILPTVLILLSLALAGCLGSPPDQGPDAPPSDGGDGGDGDAGPGGNGDAGDDGTDAGDGTGSDGGAGGNGSAPPPRTPTDAMEGEPADSGEGWAKFVVEGTASPTVRVIFDFFSDRYESSLALVGDETLVEAVLRWDSEYADLDLCLEDEANDTISCADHGMQAQEALNALPTSSVNGTLCEHLALSTQDLGELERPQTMGIYVREGEVWEPTSAPGEVQEGAGMPWTLEVWVHTVPGQEPQQAPWDDAACTGG